jgi:hypothetical protein
MIGTEASFLGYVPIELARLQIELEYDLTTDGLLVPIEGGTERARSCIYVYGEESWAFFRYDMPANARREIADSLPGVSSTAPAELLSRLGGASINRSETYLPMQPFPAVASRRVRLIDGRFVVLGPKSQAVSFAWSIRESERAAECAVETLEPFRRRGLASEVVAAWMNAGLAANKVPFYSHAASNDASRALAVHLSLTHVFTVFAVS